MPQKFRALAFVLFTATGSTSVSAQQLTCFTVRPGDTAAGLAQRFTGNPQNRHQAWFQIVNPDTAAVVPKSRYDDIQSGWHACVTPARLTRASAQRTDYSASPSSPVVRRTGLVDNILWVALLWATGSVLLLGWVETRRYIDRTRSTVEGMKGFGDKFVAEFERPLLRGHVGERPIRSRLRCTPGRQRLDVLVAPANGRTYPNLIDHRRNVEYDVERVMGLLSREPVLLERPFLNGPLRSEGPWVVIPISLRKQEGVT